MVKSLVDSSAETENSVAKANASNSKPPSSSGKATSADQINGWANSEIIIGETETYLEGLLENIRGGRRVNLKGSIVTSIDRYNPTK